MNLFDGIEKLINEHGSAAILRERLSLASDQFKAMELSAKEATLRAEAAQLSADKASGRVQQLEAENQALRLEIERFKQSADTHSPRLDEVREKILVLLASKDSLESAIANAVSASPQVVAFHLREMESARLIGRNLSMTGTALPWYINQEGRRYLVAHDLLK